MNKMLHGLATGCLVFAASLSLAQDKAPNDAQIAGIVVAANTVDINAGEVAKASSQNRQVKEFAQRMVTDHTGVNRQATELVRKLNVTPEESDTSKALKDAGAANIAKLKGMKGAAFDTAYIGNEVTYHQTVLDAIDKTLIPSAKNAELKGLLEKVRPAIDAHLQHAKQLQASMK
jgi:putative membrane protein